AGRAPHRGPAAAEAPRGHPAPLRALPAQVLRMPQSGLAHAGDRSAAGAARVLLARDRARARALDRERDPLRLAPCGLPGAAHAPAGGRRSVEARRSNPADPRGGAGAVRRRLGRRQRVGEPSRSRVGSLAGQALSQAPALPPVAALSASSGRSRLVRIGTSLFRNGTGLGSKEWLGRTCKTRPALAGKCPLEIRESGTADAPE